MQAVAAKIADALHSLEREIAKLPDDAAHAPLKAKTKLLHGRLHAAAVKHGPAIGVDVAPLSGGTPKPPAQ